MQAQVTDLGAVLHMVGGTAASFMIFVLPGLMLVNAAIVKGPAGNLESEGSDGSPAAPLGHNQDFLHEVLPRSGRLHIHPHVPSRLGFPPDSPIFRSPCLNKCPVSATFQEGRR